MRCLRIPLLLSFTLFSIASPGQGPARRLDAPPEGTVLIEQYAGCGRLAFASDGLFAAAITWADAGVSSPPGGAFAQRFTFSDTTRICAVGLALTQIGGYDSQHCVIYIWSGSPAQPGAVAFAQSVNIGPMATWPYVGRHLFAVDACVAGDTWIGYWPDWPGASEGWYIAADLAADTGAALTYVAPGVADETGWQSVSLFWEGIGVFGVTVEHNPTSCAITPTEERSWGRIKALYGRP